MLTQISVSNFAIIDELKLNFQKGLTIITGETGAGKSILLGALKLVLGERADSKLIGNESKKCVIEANFDLSGLELKPFFEENDLDYESESIFRRELLPNGKSRAFINDTPVTLEILNSLSNKLIDIHSQFNSANLLDENFQLQILDAYAGQIPVLKDYKILFADWNKKKTGLKNLKDKLRQQANEADFRQFLLDELQNANLQNDEFEALENEQKELQNIDEIKLALSESGQKLEHPEIGIIEQLREINSQIQKISGFSSAFGNLNERINSAKIELEDILDEISHKLENLDSNPERLSEVNERLNLLNQLLAKHRVNSVEGLIEIQENLETENAGFGKIEAEITTLENEIITLEEKLNSVSNQISTNREKAIPKVKKELLDSLSKLGMENSRLEIKLERTENFTENGKNKIEFLFNANKTANLLPVAKAVSGGERSRLMLAVKKLMAGKLELPTLILDEIDTGVSGKIANEVGNLMKEMAKQTQLICITHLPQVAAKGNQHFKVQKKNIQNTTRTEVVKLNPEERILEIAELISGSNVSENAIKQAQELLTA
jgi:DNA repair protein RecN (Recombination protein N)